MPRCGALGPAGTGLAVWQGSRHVWVRSSWLLGLGLARPGFHRGHGTEPGEEGVTSGCYLPVGRRTGALAFVVGLQGGEACSPDTEACRGVFSGNHTIGA